MSGGAVLVDDGSAVNFLDCIFTGNHADVKGGAISAEGKIHINRSSFMENSANIEGGAIYVGEGGSNSKIDECKFFDLDR